uniref:ArsR family transcriptional regulator n=1 Tax=Ignisphaera aggregans TaxID=334771 RepID=A0A7C4BCX0_9CREN
MAEALTPYAALASTLTYIVLSTLEPFSSFGLEPLAVYHMGRLREFSGKPRLWLRGLRDLEVVKALSEDCLSTRDVAERCSIPVESARRRLTELSRGGLVEGFRSGRRTVYCLTTAGRMLIA